MIFTAGVPVFPTPPEEYDAAYVADLIRALNYFVDQVGNAGPMRGTTLVLTDLPTSGAQLETGAVYSDNGTLKIVLVNVGYASSVSAALSIGTVTVTTS